MGSHHPFSAGRGELPILIHAFLKRVAEHPEERDFAASTVLHEADNDVLRLCGDCGFGLIVQACLICHYLSTKFNRQTP